MNYKLKILGLVAFVGVSISAILLLLATSHMSSHFQQINSPQMKLADEMLNLAFNKYIP